MVLAIECIVCTYSLSNEIIYTVYTLLTRTSFNIFYFFTVDIARVGCKQYVIRVKELRLRVFVWVYPWGPPRIKIGGGHKWQHKYTLYILYTGAAPEFWWGGDIRKNFIHEFLSSPVLQWRLQNFGWKKTFSRNILIKDFWKILKKFIKHLHKNLKFLQNSSKIKFNRI